MLLRQAQSQHSPLLGVIRRQRIHQVLDSICLRGRAIATLENILPVGRILMITWLLDEGEFLTDPVRISGQHQHLVAPCLLYCSNCCDTNFASVVPHGNGVDKINLLCVFTLPCLTTIHAVLQCFVLLWNMVPRREAKS